MLNPGGIVPLVLVQVYGEFPPLTLTQSEYDAPTVAFLKVQLIVSVEAGRAFIVSGRVFVTLPAEFVAVIFTLNEPDALGVPVIFPVLEQVSSLGSPDADQVIGVVPEAESCMEYDAPCVPFGRLVVVIVGAVSAVEAFIVSARFFVTLFTEFVAVMFTVKEPDVLGVPVILPAVEHDKPVGSPEALHVIGVVPEAESCVEYDVPCVPFGRLVVVIVGAVSVGVGVGVGSDWYLRPDPPQV